MEIPLEMAVACEILKRQNKEKKTIYRNIRRSKRLKGIPKKDVAKAMRFLLDWGVLQIEGFIKDGTYYRTYQLTFPETVSVYAECIKRIESKEGQPLKIKVGEYLAR